MNILFITTQFPYPLDNGGKIGAFNGISVASRDFEVTVLSFSEEPEMIEEGMEYYKKILPSVNFEMPVIHDVHIRDNKFKLIKAMLNGYIKRLPYIVSKFDDLVMFKRIDQMFINRKKWDYVFIDYLNMNLYGDYIRKKYGDLVGQFIFKDHNIEYELVHQEAMSSSILKKMALLLETKRTLIYEKNAIQKAKKVFSVCEPNTEVIKKYNERCWTMLPTYDMLKHRELVNDSKSILYMGNLSWKSNMEGLSWFVENVFPRIIEKLPEVNLTIVGSGPYSKLTSDNRNITYLGYVKDISHIYDNEKVFIVPLFEGSGIRIKILEAFNNEIAVVSTELACKTIGAKNNEEILIANNEEEFCKSVISLLVDDKKNEKIRMAGKKLLEQKFSLAKRQDEFFEIMMK